jgi:hypothetical protein
MKRYSEMTPEELVALTDDQVRRLIDIEIAFAAIKPVEVPVEPTLEAAGITASVIGYKVGELVFLDEKDARAVAALPVLKEAYSYGISYNHRWLEPSECKVEKAAFYKQEDVLRIGSALKENESRRNVYDKQKSDYDEYLRKTTDISSGVWRAVKEARDKLAEIEAAKRAYQKYLGLADGDHQIARKFFQDAFKSYEELVETVLATECKENVQEALPLNDSNPEQKENADGK